MNPKKYHCVTVDDSYIDDWWNQLIAMKTYFHCINKPEMALARWGVTLIPPRSLCMFEEIVLQDKRMNTDNQLIELVNLIQRAKKENKFMIHYGI